MFRRMSDSLRSLAEAPEILKSGMVCLALFELAYGGSRKLFRRLFFGRLSPGQIGIGDHALVDLRQDFGIGGAGVLLRHRDLRMLLAPENPQPQRQRIIVVDLAGAEHFEILVLPDQAFESATLRSLGVANLAGDARSLLVGHSNLLRSPGECI